MAARKEDEIGKRSDGLQMTYHFTEVQGIPIRKKGIEQALLQQNNNLKAKFQSMQCWGQCAAISDLHPE